MSARNRLRYRYLWAATAVALTAALIVSDSSSRMLNPFWRSHPIISAIASGALFLFIASFIVELLIDWVERRRWRRIANVTYRSLAVAMGRSRRTLEWAVGANVKTRLRAESETIDRVREALDSHARRLTAAGSRSSRLELLLTDQSWIAAVRRLLVDEKDAGRELLARWIPLILASGEFAKELEHLAAINDAVSDLEKSLSAVHDAPDVERDGAIREWNALLERLLSAEREFAHLANLADWDGREAIIRQ